MQGRGRNGICKRCNAIAKKTDTRSDEGCFTKDDAELCPTCNRNKVSDEGFLVMDRIAGNRYVMKCPACEKDRRRVRSYVNEK